jgi:hypothetical protein
MIICLAQNISLGIFLIRTYFARCRSVVIGLPMTIDIVGQALIGMLIVFVQLVGLDSGLLIGLQPLAPTSP